MGEGTDLADALLKIVGDTAGVQAVSQFIDTGYPPLNRILSGRYDDGLPFGRMIEVYGGFSTGKTSMAVDWMARAQQMGGVAVFIDWERSFNVHLGEGFGLDTSPGRWVFSQPETWEQGNIIADEVCAAIRTSGEIAATAPIIVVFDSIASAVPRSVLDKKLDELSMNDSTALARVISQTLKIMASRCEKYNATFVYLNQTREKPGVIYGSNIVTPGGKAMEFYASGRLMLTRQNVKEDRGGEREFSAQVINIQCTKSKFTQPYQKCALRMTFDENGAARFDKIYSLLEHLVDKKIIESAKSRVTWTDDKQYFIKALAAKLTEENAYDQLVGLLVSPR